MRETHYLALGQGIETHKQDATVLHVQWNGIGSLLKIASNVKRRKNSCKLSITLPDTIHWVWHDEMPVFTMTDNTDYWAFFRPEKGELNTLTLAHNEYWLPENVQETLLLRNQVPSNCEKFVVEQHERLLIPHQRAFAARAGRRAVSAAKQGKSEK